MMMAIAPRRALAAAAALCLAAAGACSFMEDYDITGKPCNSEGKCLDGYYCSKYDGCQRADAGSHDAGSRDAGSRDGGQPTSDASQPTSDAGHPDTH